MEPREVPQDHTVFSTKQFAFLSALHVHGAISQIPTAIQIATTGHGRVLATEIRLTEENIEALTA